MKTNLKRLLVGTIVVGFGFCLWGMFTLLDWLSKHSPWLFWAAIAVGIVWFIGFLICAPNDGVVE